MSGRLCLLIQPNITRVHISAALKHCRDKIVRITAEKWTVCAVTQREYHTSQL